MSDESTGAEGASTDSGASTFDETSSSLQVIGGKFSSEPLDDQKSEPKHAAEIGGKGDADADDEDDEPESETKAEGEPDGDDTPEPEDDDAEEELDGLKVVGKKALIEKLKADRQAVAEVAAARQAIEQQVAKFAEQQKQLEKWGELQKEQAEVVGDLSTMEREVAQLRGIDLNALAQVNLQQAQWVQFRLGQLNDYMGNARNILNHNAQALTAKQHAALEEKAAKGYAELSGPKGISGWGPELAMKIAEHAISLGYSVEELSRETNPVTVRLLHKSYIESKTAKAAEKAIQTAKAQGRATPPTKPVGSLSGSGRGGGSVDLEKVSMDDFMKDWSKKQRAASRNR